MDFLLCIRIFHEAKSSDVHVVKTVEEFFPKEIFQSVLESNLLLIQFLGKRASNVCLPALLVQQKLHLKQHLQFFVQLRAAALILRVSAEHFH